MSSSPAGRQHLDRTQAPGPDAGLFTK